MGRRSTRAPQGAPRQLAAGRSCASAVRSATGTVLSAHPVCRPRGGLRPVGRSDLPCLLHGRSQPASPSRAQRPAVPYGSADVRVTERLVNRSMRNSSALGIHLGGSAYGYTLFSATNDSKKCKKSPFDRGLELVQAAERARQRTRQPTGLLGQGTHPPFQPGRHLPDGDTQPTRSLRGPIPQHPRNPFTRSSRRSFVSLEPLSS